METDIQFVINLMSHLITCVVFLIALAMCRGFVVRGISLAIAEYLLRLDDEEKISWMCRWFGNGKEISEYLLEIKNKFVKEKTKK